MSVRLFFDKFTKKGYIISRFKSIDFSYSLKFNINKEEELVSDRKAALEMALKQIEKQFGKGLS